MSIYRRVLIPGVIIGINLAILLIVVWLLVGPDAPR